MKIKAICFMLLAAAVFVGCEEIDSLTPVNRTDAEGRLVEISGTIGRVYARKSTPDPGDSPQQFYSLGFGDLDPGAYTVHMCVEKEMDGVAVVFDIARAPVSAEGRFTLQMPSVVQSEWLDMAPDGLMRLWNATDWLRVELDAVPDEIEISAPDADVCAAYLYMERAGDGQRFEISYGGPDKESYHTTDLSSVSSSILLYTSTAVDVAGKADVKPYPALSYGYTRAFDVSTPGGWSWVHCVTNGMSGYLGWATAYPDWAVMGYSARAVYDDMYTP